MNTVEEKMKAFTKRDVEGAKTARKLYAKLVYPSNANFKWLIKNTQIKNSEVSVRNIDIPQDIWGKDISSLKGKNFRGKPNVVDSDCINIPKDIANPKKAVFLTDEILFVNGIPFFISMSRKIDFIGVSRLNGRTAAIIFDAFKDILDSIYREASVSRPYLRMVNSECSKI